jgi:hypothetical protein
MCNDVDQAVGMLSSKLNNILDIMAPVKTIQIHTRYAPWLSEDTKKLMDKRNAVQKKAAESRDADDWREYKSLRNSATARMKVEERIGITLDPLLNCSTMVSLSTLLQD